MGFFDFLKRNKNVSEFPTAPPASASSPSPVSDSVSKLPEVPDLTTTPSPLVVRDQGLKPPRAPEPSVPELPLVAMARIVTGDDPMAVDGLRLFLEDEEAFAAAHPAWYLRVTADDMSVTDLERLYFIFTKWLIYNDEEGFSYGSYMDKKQQPEALLSILQEVADKLGYPLHLGDLSISWKDGRSWEEHFWALDEHISAQGYELIPLYDQWWGVHLFLTPRGGRDELYTLGRKVDFDFTYPF